MRTLLPTFALLVLSACAPATGGKGPADGFGVGERVPDRALTDQHGASVSLRDFDGDVVLLDVSTMWCAPCQEVALHAEDTYREYRREGFVYVTVLQEDPHGDAPDTDDLDAWATAYGLSAPVLADGGESGERVTAEVVADGQFPAILVIGRQGVVEERVGATDDASVRDAIERAL